MNYNLLTEFHIIQSLSVARFYYEPLIFLLF